MRVLWFTNIPLLPPAGKPQEPLRGTGGWLSALASALAGGDHEVGICSAFPGLQNGCTTQGNMTFFSVAQGQPRRVLYFVPPDERRIVDTLAECRRVVEQFRPDVIHVHGTERFFGLLPVRFQVGCPVIVSLQGLMSEYCKWVNTFGQNSWPVVLTWHTPINTARGIGPLWTWLASQRQAKRELEIIRGNRNFAGRTDWDRSCIEAVNPDARYFHVGEMLRQSFYQSRWNLAKSVRETIYFSNARGPRRNVEVLLDAIALLATRWPRVHLRLGGIERFDDGYARWLKQRALRLGVLDRISLLGRLTADGVVAELLRCNVFVLPSRIENSPNSLCEAQLVGVPCVASSVGGVPSLVDSENTGLLFLPDDSAALAAHIDRVFGDDCLATALGESAAAAAHRRHDSSQIVGQLVSAYDELVREPMV